MIGVALLATKLEKLNNGKSVLFKDRYGVLRTKKKKVNSWWDSLTDAEKIEVGGVAIHCNKMTANYKWFCSGQDNFESLKTSQKRIVSHVFSRRNEPWFICDLNTFI